MNVLIVLLRIGLCAMFAVAAIAKLRDRSEVSSGLTKFGVPSALAPAGTIALIASELSVAAALAFDASATAGAAAAAAMLALFTAVIAANLVRGKRPSCNCFGADEARPIGWNTVARNVVLTGLAAFVAVRAGDAPFVATAAPALEGVRSHAAIAAAAAATCAMLAGVAFVLWQLLQQQGRILMRLEALERSGSPLPEPAAAHHGLAIGSVAPDFALTTLDGEAETIAGLGASKRPLLLVFVNPKCGPCQALLPEIARWQTDYAKALTIAIVSEGTPEENREKAIPGLGRIHLQQTREVADAYHAYGTPAAVLIDGGRIASHVAQGAGDIRTLVSNFFDGRPQPSLAIGDEAPIELRALVRDETAVLFWNPKCSFCAQMLDDLRLWEAQRAEGRPAVLIVTSVPFDAAEAGLRAPVLVDVEMRAAKAFGAMGTPMAVLLDGRGLVASNVVAGRDAVLQLVNRELAPS